jgi:DNA-binding CsgD family transcriptional regulator
VDTHRRNITQKLGVKGGALVHEAALYGLRRPKTSQ